MELTSRRTVEPLFLTLTVTFPEVDLDAAFTEQSDPDEVLYYKVFSDYWLTAPISEQLALASQIAKLAEDAASAHDLGLAAGSPEPKE